MKKILIVDDESYVRFFFKNILAKHGKYVFLKLTPEGRLY